MDPVEVAVVAAAGKELKDKHSTQRVTPPIKPAPEHKHIPITKQAAQEQKDKGGRQSWRDKILQLKRYDLW